MKRCVFFDRDGVVNIRKMGGYIQSVEEFKFIEDFLPIFKRIKEKGYLAILVTNQQGIGKGIMTEEVLKEIHNHMQLHLLDYTGYSFDDIYFCPELDSAGSFRRKPNPGMLLEAIDKWDIDKENSFMIGDTDKDAIAGRKAGIKTIIITEKQLSANHIFKKHADLLEKIDGIIPG
ncbi:MAG: D-glycero-alpha-D-manno-heptose-1,7-bisphosphate 7-phosphatase [Candidatus Kapaibacterium sp.]